MKLYLLKACYLLSLSKYNIYDEYPVRITGINKGTERKKIMFVCEISSGNQNKRHVKYSKQR